MKTVHRFKVFALILGSALSLCLGSATNAQAQERIYMLDLKSRTATEIRGLGGVWTGSSWALNDAGQVAGTSGGHAFITGPNGVGVRALGPLGAGASWANDIDNAGRVVGGFGTSGGTYRAFITGPDGIGMSDLGTLPGGGYSNAKAISDAGHVVGDSDSALIFPYFHAFLTNRDGMDMRDLGVLGGPGSGELSWATGVNEAGQVVGGFGLPPEHAFITGPDGFGMRVIGNPGDGLSAINKAGQAVGTTGRFFDKDAHAFITGPDGMGMRDLGTLGGSDSGASAINNAGQVVGISGISLENEFDQHAFITGPDGVGMIDLNSLVELPDGVFLLNATDINNAGQVLAVGVIPEPEAYALFLAGLGLMGFVARRKQLLV
jgi:probable HAF family extracellular repeat protein